jgi:hypothetical protein
VSLSSLLLKMEAMWAFTDRCVGEIFSRLPKWQDLDPLLLGCASMLACSLILGGATRSGFPGDLILDFLAIPLLALGLWRLFELDIMPQIRWALWFCAALIALPLLQLVPLPPWLWTALPHREISAESFALVGKEAPWMPMSVSPQATWLSALSLIPPLSLFIGVLLLGYRDRRWLSLVIFAVGVISAFLGLMQVAQGPTSSLRFYQFTNPTEAVGFFANRNHFAALLYVVLLIASAWAINAGTAAGLSLSRKEFDATSILLALGCFTVIVVLIAAEAMARSRAGLGLMMIALFGAFFLGVSDRVVIAVTPRKLLLVAIALALVLSLQFALYGILQRFETEDVGPGSRTTLTANTIQAARVYMPVGSGLGSFVPVYHTFEPAKDVVPNVYANTAVNDVAQSWLETGVFGLALMGWFAFWFVRRSLEIWRSGLPSPADAIDWSLCRSATIIVPLLAAHAFLDYLFRTSAILVVTAFACALMFEPPPTSVLRAEAQRSVRASAKRGARVSAAPVLGVRTVIPPPKPQTQLSAPSGRKERWGMDMEWPEEWRAKETKVPGRPSDPK